MSEFTPVLEHLSERFPEPPVAAGGCAAPPRSAASQPTDRRGGRGPGHHARRRAGAVERSSGGSSPSRRIGSRSTTWARSAWRGPPTTSAARRWRSRGAWWSRHRPNPRAGSTNSRGTAYRAGSGTITCMPAWSAPEGQNALTHPLTLSGDSIFGGSSNGGLQVFPADCPERTCERSWKGPTPAYGQGLGCQAGGHCFVQMRGIRARVAYAAVDPHGLDQLWAFPTRCAASTCHELWSAARTGPPAIVGSDRVAADHPWGDRDVRRSVLGGSRARMRTHLGPSDGLLGRPSDHLDVPAARGRRPRDRGGRRSILALRSSDGEQVWSASTDGEPSRLVLADDLVIATGGAPPPISVRSRSRAPTHATPPGSPPPPRRSTQRRSSPVIGCT